MYKRLEKEKGVTLIALIIAVILMLIIAGVAMSMLSGNDGLFTKTKYAADKYNNSLSDETEVMDDIMSMLINTDAVSYSINTSKPTNKAVTVALSLQEGYTTQYRIGEEGDWKDYDSLITMNKNGNIYTRLKDSKGRFGTPKTIIINNIDTIQPNEFPLEVKKLTNWMMENGQKKKLKIDIHLKILIQA